MKGISRIYNQVPLWYVSCKVISCLPLTTATKPFYLSSLPPFLFLLYASLFLLFQPSFLLSSSFSFLFIFFLSLFPPSFLFLDATTHLYKRSCPSVRRSVRPSVRPSRVFFERRKSWILRIESPQMI